MTEEEKLEKIVGVMINQPMEGLLYDWIYCLNNVEMIE